MISTFILVCEVILLFLVCEFDAIKNVKFLFCFIFVERGNWNPTLSFTFIVSSLFFFVFVNKI